MKFSASVVAVLASALAINGVLAIPQVVNPVPQNILEPVQFRVAFAGKEAGKAAAVSWNTYGELSGAPTLRYGLDPDNLSKVASGESNTYATSTTWNHHVVLEGLEPDTVYYYRVEGSDASKTFHFKTALAPGTNKEFTFAAAIDLGVMGEYGLSTWVGDGAEGPLKEGEKNTIDSLLDDFDKYEFILHPGDIAYSDYWLKEEVQGYLPKSNTVEEGIYAYEALLNTYYQQMEGLTAYKQYMVSPGNHEANCNNGGTTDKKNNITYTADMCFEGQTNFTGLRKHFRMPGDESGGVGNMWYSFDNGLVHFVSINTETDFEDAPSSTDMRSGEFGYPGQQLEWLRADLANVDREKTPWVIVSGHRPWYIDQKKKNVCKECQDAFEDILVDGNVDLVLTGHVHFYERNHPVAHGVVDPNGLNNPSAPWYITNGAAGHYDGIDWAAGHEEDWIAYIMDGHYGWSSFTVHNCSHLTHEFVFSENNTRLDRQTLFKDRKCKLPVEESSSVSISPATSSIPGVESGSGINSTVTKTVSEKKTTVVGTATVSKSKPVDETKTVVKSEASTVTETDCPKCHSKTNGSLLESAAETAQSEKKESKAATVVETVVHETVVGSVKPTVSVSPSSPVASAPVASVGSSAVVASSSVSESSAPALQPSTGAAGSTPALANVATLARISPMVMGVALVALPALAMQFA